jgi:pyruvate,orthophosphate dikinase
MAVRSGARDSMPGMMDTILNLGLNDETVLALAARTGNERFAWDSYRRFIQMYGDVVMGLKPTSKEEHDPFEVVIDVLKHATGRPARHGAERRRPPAAGAALQVTDPLAHRARLPHRPLGAALGRGAGGVRELEQRPRQGLPRAQRHPRGVWGTAVNVQAMVFGNLGDTSATGVAFTRDAGTGEDLFNGEFLVNAQGEDVVAGIRTPQQITLVGSRRWAELAQVGEDERRATYPSLEELMPGLYQELLAAETTLENHFRDMQDLEFTIQEGKLWMLQTRNGKRTGAAMVRIAMEMLAQGMIDERTALLRVTPDRLNDLLHPVFDAQALKGATPIARGLPASPGAATGQIVFHADEAEAWHKEGRAVILVRQETSPEDLRGMSVAQGILTARGGMTSHAAVVARGMGKCCVSGAGAVHVDLKARTMTVGGITWHQGDWLSLNGSTGEVFDGRIPTQDAELSGDFGKLMALADAHKRLEVRANADTPLDATVARRLGATGIGLCRTEHMFFEGDRITPCAR